MNIHPDTYELIRRKSTYPVIQKHGINRHELWMLSQLNGLLGHLDKTLISKKAFFCHITRNVREHNKMAGYYSGLLRKGFVGAFEYVNVPGSESCGISDLGARVLNDYHLITDKLSQQYMIKEQRVANVVTFTTGTTEGNYLRKSA